jgi:hypothetical protein
MDRMGRTLDIESGTDSQQCVEHAPSTEVVDRQVEHSTAGTAGDVRVWTRYAEPERALVGTRRGWLPPTR